MCSCRHHAATAQGNGCQFRGFSAERLYAYRDQGIVEQISRGLYRWSDAPEIDQNLLEVAYRIPEGTLCLTTALARHGLTDNISARIDVAIPRGNRIPTLLSPVDIRVFSKDAFNLGRGEFKVGEGFVVGLYSPERSLVGKVPTWRRARRSQCTRNCSVKRASNDTLAGRRYLN